MDDDEQRRALERATDPWYDQRVEMPTHEFDAVDFFVHERRRSPAPPPLLAVYLDSDLTAAAFGDRLGAVVEDMTRTVSATTPLTMRPRLISYAAGGGSVTNPWNQESLDAVRAVLREQPIRLFGVSIEDPAGEEFWWLNYETAPEHPEAAVQLSLTPTHDLWPADAVGDIAERLLDLVRSWVRPLALRCAAVTYDQVRPGHTPWEVWYNVHPWDSAPATRDRLRGYFWANLLTGGHLRRLGGLESLRTRAAAHGLDVQPLPEPDTVIVRAPGPITKFDDDQLAAMKQLLTPALIPARYGLYEGYPLRIIPDPGTAFRRVPPGSPYPRLVAQEADIDG